MAGGRHARRALLLHRLWLHGAAPRYPLAPMWLLDPSHCVESQGMPVVDLDSGTVSAARDVGGLDAVPLARCSLGVAAAQTGTDTASLDASMSDWVSALGDSVFPVVYSGDENWMSDAALRFDDLVHAVREEIRKRAERHGTHGLAGGSLERESPAHDVFQGGVARCPERNLPVELAALHCAHCGNSGSVKRCSVL